MDISSSIKSCLNLSNLVIEGLGHLGTSIPLEVAKKIISNSVKLTLHPEASEFYVRILHSNNC